MRISDWSSDVCSSDLRKQGKGTFVASDVDESPSRGDFSELVRPLRQPDARSTLKDVDIATVAADEATERHLDLPVRPPVVQDSFVRMPAKAPTGPTAPATSGQLGTSHTPAGPPEDRTQFAS